MNFEELNEIDHVLIQQATKLIKERYCYKRQTVACAILTKDNQIITGVNIKGSFGPINNCAEQTALGNAITQNQKKLTTLVAVRHSEPNTPLSISVVSPCGICREFISDYAPNMQVIIPIEQQFKKIAISYLLPYRFTKL